MNYSNTGSGVTLAILEHLSEETIDLHACGRLSGEALDSADDHLLICEPCRQRQAEADAFFRTLMASPVARQVRSDVEKKIAARARRFSAGWWLVPAFAMLGFVVFQNQPGSAPTPPVEVTLLALRSGPGTLTAPAGRPLRLRLDLTGLSAETGLRAEVVTITGQRLFMGDARLDGGHAVIAAPALGQGVHWVRLYRGGTLLREYTLNVRP